MKRYATGAEPLIAFNQVVEHNGTVHIGKTIKDYGTYKVCNIGGRRVHVYFKADGTFTDNISHARYDEQQKFLD